MFRQWKSVFFKQKSWALLFVGTIILPSAILSIFGLIGLRNERFRMQQQIREERISLIDSVKSEILYELDQLVEELGLLTNSTSFRNRDYKNMLHLVQNHLEREPLSEQFFVVFKDSPPWFPPFRGEGSGFQSNPIAVFSADQQRQLEKALKLEFTQRDYTGAISLLSGLLPALEAHPQLRMEVLSYLARIQRKAGAYDIAIDLYREIIRDAPLNISYQGTYLPLSVRFPLVDCLLEKGENEKALQENLLAFKQILAQYNSIGEDQFKAYASLAKDQFEKIKKDKPQLLHSLARYEAEYDSLNNRYDAQVGTWTVIHRLQAECLPVISRELEKNRQNPNYVARLTRNLGSENYLLIAMFMPSEQPGMTAGYAGIRISDDYLKSHIVPEIFRGKNKTGWKDMAIYDLDGELIFGQSFPVENKSLISSMFNHNFPPWRIDASLQQPGPRLLTWLLKSFYFWTLLVLLAILVFGLVIIGRIIAQEKEVLKLKENFVSSVSHEFKTPIASIIALSESLLKGNVSNEVRLRDYYSVIARDANSLNHLVENFLDFSKMEEGKKTYLYEKTRLDEWLKDLIITFSARVSGYRFFFQHTEGERPILIHMDRNSMKLALHNLLDNAAKFSDPGSEIILQLEKEEDKILIKCKDEGTGIPFPEQEKIFQKFYRGRQESQMPGTGTGLGLAIVKQVAEAHGGQIRVTSEPGQGTTMTMVLPGDIHKTQISDE